MIDFIYSIILSVIFAIMFQENNLLAHFSKSTQNPLVTVAFDHMNSVQKRCKG
jgi:hypothetical protein